MATKTIHVYQSNGAWAVKKEGSSALTFSTRRKAVDAAKKKIRSSRAGQFVVYGKNGLIQEYEVHGMPPIQDPPKKSPIADRIERAVSKMTLQRVQSDPLPPSDHSTKK